MTLAFGAATFAVSGVGSRDGLDSPPLDTLAPPLDGRSPDSTECFAGGGSDASSFPTPEAERKAAKPDTEQA